MYFRTYRPSKTWVDHSVKNALSEQSLNINMQKHHKYLQSRSESGFIMFFIILGEVDLENVSRSFRWTLRSVC